MSIKMRNCHRIAVAFAVILPCVAVAYPQNPNGKYAALHPDTLTAVHVRGPQKTSQFRVIDPLAKTSEAWLDDPSRGASEYPQLSLSNKYTLTNRIVVQVEDETVLKDALADYPGASYKPIMANRGFWLVAVDSILEAAIVADDLGSHEGFITVELDVAAPLSLRSTPTDPFFYEQWEIHNELDPLYDVNAEAAWNMGYTGAGVIVGILDAGHWQYNHIDLAANYLEEASQLNGAPQQHATNCAGIIGEVADNGIHGAGVAYGALISGQRFGSDSETAEALLFRNDLNDIKSNSWGPDDNDAISLMPSVIKAALEEGVSEGRQGLGEIFVWAAGNGGSADRMDYDPYASSRYTIAVGAVGDDDQRAYYSEKGASLMAVAHSDGAERMIATTSTGNAWTRSFGGTSAAAPLASGAVALMLEANPSLTWRDVQHVLIDSARRCHPEHSSWVANGSGRYVSYIYGYGAVDAGAAVAMAAEWENVPHEVTIDANVDVNLDIPDGDRDGLVIPVQIPDNLIIESIELIPHVLTENIGHLEIIVTSPSGLNSKVAQHRYGDGMDDYAGYTFTSLRYWGEESSGEWLVNIADYFEGSEAHWIGFRLLIHGVPACPGDLVPDGVINLADVFELLTAYNATETDALFNPAADFNNDKRITLSDLAELLSLYGKQCN